MQTRAKPKYPPNRAPEMRLKKIGPGIAKV